LVNVLIDDHPVKGDRFCRFQSHGGTPKSSMSLDDELVLKLETCGDLGIPRFKKHPIRGYNLQQIRFQMIYIKLHIWGWVKTTYGGFVQW